MVVRHDIIDFLPRETLKVVLSTIENHNKFRGARKLEFHAVQPPFVGSEDNGHPSKSLVSNLFFRKFQKIIKNFTNTHNFCYAWTIRS